MKKFAVSTAVTGIIVVAALGWSGTAQAAPTGDASAADTIKSLQGLGYNVQINGSVTAPLTQCLVTGVHGLPNSSAVPTGFTTVYVDVDCPPSNN
jgi:hypothetical protein